MAQASNSLTPRTAEAQLNEAAAMSDICEEKVTLVRPLLQWVGDNIVTLRDRNLLDNLEKPALILLGEQRGHKNYHDDHVCCVVSEIWSPVSSPQ